MTKVLDTDVCVHLIRKSNDAVLRRLREHDPGDLALSAVTVGELFFGAYRSIRVAEALRLLDRFIEPFQVLPFDVTSAGIYGEIRSELARRGETIGSNDLLIAATARAHDCIVVTHNTREFGRVPHLRLEDWEA